MGAQISRGHLFTLGRGAASGDPEAIMRLLWHVLAWGAGVGARNNHRRLDAIEANRDLTVGVLRRAGERASSDPRAAYSELRTGRRNAVAWLGPAFFTRYLYFVGGGAESHPALILDARVAQALRTIGWRSLQPGGSWPPFTYQRYCQLLVRWADQISVDGRHTTADELERWLFATGGKQAH